MVLAFFFFLVTLSVAVVEVGNVDFRTGQLVLGVIIAIGVIVIAAYSVASCIARKSLVPALPILILIAIACWSKFYVSPRNQAQVQELREITAEEITRFKAGFR
jgi:Kef-type K+ transport system membrane component KefB